MSAPLDLDPIRARVARTEPGAWTCVLDRERHWMSVLANSGTEYERIIAKCADDDDADTIANDHADIPALLAEVDRLRDVIGRAREEVTAGFVAKSTFSTRFLASTVRGILSEADQ